MTADQGHPDSDELKAALRRIFDSQIPNYGSYNLVCASPAGDDDRHYVLGYRWNPLELILAPFDPQSLQGVEVPTSVGSTNLAHTELVGPGRLAVATITGRVFTFEVHPKAGLPATEGAGVIEQAADLEDFTAFLAEFRRIG